MYDETFIRQGCDLARDGATQPLRAPTAHMVSAGVPSTEYLVLWKAKKRLRIVEETRIHVAPRGP